MNIDNGTDDLGNLALGEVSGGSFVCGGGELSSGGLLESGGLGGSEGGEPDALDGDGGRRADGARCEAEAARSDAAGGRGGSQHDDGGIGGGSGSVRGWLSGQATNAPSMTRKLGSRGSTQG